MVATLQPRLRTPIWSSSGVTRRSTPTSTSQNRNASSFPSSYSVVLSYGGSRRDIFEKTLLSLNTEHIIVPLLLTPSPIDCRYDRSHEDQGDERHCCEECQQSLAGRSVYEHEEVSLLIPYSPLEVAVIEVTFGSSGAGLRRKRTTPWVSPRRSYSIWVIFVILIRVVHDQRRSTSRSLSSTTHGPARSSSSLIGDGR